MHGPVSDPGASRTLDSGILLDSCLGCTDTHTHTLLPVGSSDEHARGSWR